jgi:hypothetical protein
MKRALKLLVVTLSLISPSLTPVNQAHAAAYGGVGVTTNNLVMYFDAANYSGFSAPTWTDLSGNGNTATTAFAGSGVAPSLVASNGYYLNFSGNGNANGGYLSIPSFSTGGSDWSGISISMYVNIGSVYSNVERVFDFGNGSPSDNFWVGTGDNGQMAMEVFNNTASNGWCRSTNNAAAINEWAHWTFTFDGTNCKVYKNNVLNNTVAYTYRPKANITLTRNYIGKSNWAADPYFEGKIADLAIYKGVLSDAERLQNYNAQTDTVAPVVTTSSISGYETSTAIGTLSFTGSPTTFWLTGPDSGYFTLSNSGVLAFSSLQNYEVRTVAGGSSNYDITIWAMDANGNTDHWSIVVQLQNAIESSTLSSPTLSATPYKGLSVTITVTPAGDGTAIPGKITYLMAGKRIVGCYKKIYSGTGSSTCSWKPTTMGYREISVTFTPTNTSFSAASTKKTFWVYKRTTNR